MSVNNNIYHQFEKLNFKETDLIHRNALNREIALIISDFQKEHLQDIINAQNIIENWLKKRTSSQLSKILKYIFRNLNIHGQYSQGGTKIFNNSDIDGYASKLLLSECDLLDNIEINYLKYGQSQKGLNIDTGGVPGIKRIFTDEFGNKSEQFNQQFGLFGSTLILDHHPEGVASSTFILYSLLDKLGLIPIEKISKFKKFVNFVNMVDRYSYQIDAWDRQNSHKTIFGLREFIPLKAIYDYFGQTDNSLGLLSDNILKSINIKEKTLYEISLQHRNFLDQANKTYLQKLNKNEILECQGMKYIIDLNQGLRKRQALNCKHKHASIKLYPGGNLYIYNPFGIPQELHQFGLVINKTILIISSFSNNHLPHQLSELLEYFQDDYKMKPQILEAYTHELDTIKNGQYLSAKKSLLRNKFHLYQEKIKTFPNISNQNITVGQQFKGIVKLIYNYGMFVDIGGVDVFVHKNKYLNHKNKYKLSSKKIKYNILDEIELIIIEIHHENGKTKYSGQIK